MFGFRTPAKDPRDKSKSPEKTQSPREITGTKVAQARQSLESQMDKPEGTGSAGPSRPKPRGIPSETKGAIKKPASAITITTPEKSANMSRTAEAKACLMKIKLQINNSRNIKTEIKNDVLEATERLYKLVTESEGERKREQKKDKTDMTESPDPAAKAKSEEKDRIGQEQLLKKLEEHSEMLQKNTEEMEKLKEEIKTHREELKEGKTYAAAVMEPKRVAQVERPMHSIVITAEDEKASGEEVFERIRTTLNAREEGMKIDRMRKARDRKVIVGCKSKEEIGRIKDRLRKDGKGLNVEEVQNKEPMVLLKDVLSYNTDEDIVRALISQNKDLLGDFSGDEKSLRVKFRRRARNPHASHVAVQVPPSVWKRFTEAGAVHIDVQRVRVEDQSPLIQCSRCLGYGHGKRFCREQVDVCSHCGGAHHRSECADWLARVPPSCCNCTKAKLGGAGHNAFSPECPVRRKWDILARSAVAYC